MKEKDQKKKDQTTPPTDDDRLDIKKSVFEVNREIREQKQREEEERQEEIRRKIAEREKKRQEEYDRKILEEKKELIRLKQGLIEESEEIHEEIEKPVKLSFWKKIGNFFYHNKWWLGIAAVFVFIAAVLTHNLLTKTHPDMVVLVICESDIIGDAPDLEKYLTSMAEDFNGNGKTQVSVYFIQMTDSPTAGYASGSDTKLTTELNSAESVLVIGDSKFLETVDPENDLLDMSDYFPDDTNVRGGRYYLRNTNFAKRVGLEKDDVSYDIFIALRKPQTLLYAKQSEMEETLAKDLPVLERIIEDLSREE